MNDMPYAVHNCLSFSNIMHDIFERQQLCHKPTTYMFCQIPPAPPRPDFDASREKLQRLGEGEGTMTKEEFTKMKQELEA